MLRSHTPHRTTRPGLPCLALQAVARASQLQLLDWWVPSRAQLPPHRLLEALAALPMLHRFTGTMANSTMDGPSVGLPPGLARVYNGPLLQPSEFKDPALRLLA